MYLLLLLFVSLLLQSMHPSVIRRSLKNHECETSNNTLVTYWSVDFTLLFEYLYFWQIFGGQNFSGKFHYQ